MKTAQQIWKELFDLAYNGRPQHEKISVIEAGLHDARRAAYAECAEILGDNAFDKAERLIRIARDNLKQP